MSHPRIEQIFNNYDWPDFEREEWHGWYGLLENLDSPRVNAFSEGNSNGWNCKELEREKVTIEYRDKNFIIIKSRLYGLLWKVGRA